MQTDEAPLFIQARALDAIENCPASVAGGSKLQSAALERWIATNTALQGVLVGGLDIAEAVRQNTGHLDAIQAEIVADLVRVGVELLDDPETTYDFDPDDRSAQVEHPIANIVLTAHKGITATHPDGTTEYLKLRTGRGGTRPPEAAILIEDNRAGLTMSDLMVDTGAIEPIELSDAVRRQELDRLYELALVSPNRGDRRPGPHCYSCARIATCGQYPPEPGTKVGRWQRTILLTKTELLTLGECHRRVAWKRLYAIPKDHAPDDSEGAARGTRFHDLVAVALMADDPDAEFERQLEHVDAAHHEDMCALYQRHLTIESTHTPITYSHTEYQVGVTLVAQGIETDSRGHVTPDKPIAVTVIARTDGVGREADGTPAVVEHRTGANSDRIDERETALYALAVARLVKSDTVAVHQHALDAVDGPYCERIVYAADALEAATELLTKSIEPVVRWHPLDATEPEATPGQWCIQCTYRHRCPAAIT